MNSQTNLRGISVPPRKLVKFVFRSAVVGLVLVLLLLMGLNLRQFLLRKQIEKIIATVRDLQLKRASQDEIQQRLAVVYPRTQKTCADNRCAYVIQITSQGFSYTVVGRVFPDLGSPWLFRSLGSVGLHPIWLRLTVASRNGSFEGLSSGLTVGIWPSLLAGASDRCDYPERFLPRFGGDEHPGC